LLNHSNVSNNARLYTPQDELEEQLQLEEEEEMAAMSRGGRGGRRGAKQKKKAPKPKPEGDPDAHKMKAIAAIKSGEEVFNTYGELSSSELLRRYGFVEDDENPYDTVDVDFKLGM